jgi:hypothetical protein
MLPCIEIYKINVPVGTSYGQNRPDSVGINDFYSKTRASVGAEQLLTQLAAFTLWLQTITADLLFC